MAIKEKMETSETKPKRCRKKVNAREIKFCKHYLASSSYGEAYMAAGYNCSESAARQAGYRLFRKPWVQAYWRELVGPIEYKELVSSKRIISEVMSIAFDEQAGDMARLRALKLLAQINGMLIQVQEVKHSGQINTVDLSKFSTEELKALAAFNAQI